MTKDEALRLALRAMVVNNQAWKHLADSGDAGYWEAEEQGYYQLNEQAITAVEAALEAKDEPVAWMDASRFEELRNGFTVMTTLTKKKAFFDDVAIYTTPPQRTWVGLTDEDRLEFAKAQHGWEDLLVVAEAKLKEKNT